MNRTVARLTARGLLGRRRAALLLTVPALLLALAALLRLLVGRDEQATTSILGGLALGAAVPLLGLIAGTGAIGPEIDDGSIVYLLAKRLSRGSIVRTKLLVATACTIVLAAVPTLLAGLIMIGTGGDLAVAYGLGALVASAAYSAVFLLLGVATRHAVVVGLLYALLWESLVGNFVPGARTLSIQQWGLSIAESTASSGAIDADVRLAVAIPLLVLVTIGGAVLATVRLAGFTARADE